jgi:predicted transposase/invertase (TIGR01784 family)
MKTDKWFYELFLSQPGMLSELIPGFESEWSFTYSSVVVKEKEFRFDGLFTPVSDDPNIPIVFAEAQMQTDKNFYSRFFAETFLYLAQYEVNRPWRGLLILSSPGVNFGTELPYNCLLQNQVTRIFLKDLQGRKELSSNLSLLQMLVTEQEESAEIGKNLLRTAESESEYEKRLTLIETMLANKFPELTKEIIMEMLEIKTMDVTKSRFYQQIYTEGRQEGLHEGRQEGEVNLVLRLLTRKLANLSETMVKRVKKLTIPQLENLGEALLGFTQIGDLETFLSKLESKPEQSTLTQLDTEQPDQEN